MQEIRKINEKYDEPYVSEKLNTVANINAFAYTFYKDVADIYDAMSALSSKDVSLPPISLRATTSS